MEDEDLDFDDSGSPPLAPPLAPVGGLASVGATSRGDPALRQDYLTSRQRAQGAQSEYMQLMQSAIDRIVARRAGPSEGEAYLRMAAALGKPTRTGSFGESLGGLSETAADVLGERRKGEVERDAQVENLRLASGKVGLDAANRDASTAASVYLKDRQRMPDRLALITAWQEAPEGSPLKAELRRALDADLSRGQPRPATAQRDPEVVQLTRLLNDPATPPDQKASLRDRIAKLNHIPPVKGDGPSGPKKVQSVKRNEDGTSHVVFTDGSEEFRPAPEGYTPPRKAPTTTDKKAIMDAEDAIPALSSTLKAVNDAIALVPKAYHGPGSARFGDVATGASQLPIVGRMVGKDTAATAEATKRLNQLLSEQAINQMAQTLSGATTNEEMARFVKILADPNSPADAKLEVLDRMKTLASQQLATKQKRIDELKRGVYYDEPGKGETPPKSPAAGAPRRRIWKDGKLVDAPQ